MVTKAARIAVQVIWLALCITAFAHAYRDYQGSSDWELEEGLALEMMILSFPASLAVMVAVMALGAGLQLFGLALPASSRAEMTVWWLLLVAAGYIQWFILLPKVLMHRRTARHS